MQPMIGVLTMCTLVKGVLVYALVMVDVLPMELVHVIQVTATPSVVSIMVPGQHKSKSASCDCLSMFKSLLLCCCLGAI